MNIELAWEQDVIGRGVVVTILDDGLEYTHPDLRDNYVSLHDLIIFPRILKDQMLNEQERLVVVVHNNIIYKMLRLPKHQILICPSNCDQQNLIV